MIRIDPAKKTSGFMFIVFLSLHTVRDETSKPLAVLQACFRSDIPGKQAEKNRGVIGLPVAFPARLLVVLIRATKAPGDKTARFLGVSRS